MKTIKIIAFCLISTLGFAQQKMNKVSQSIKVNKNVVVDLNTSYVEIEIDTWNKDIVEVEAYIESEKLSKKDLEKALKAWKLKVQGANDKVIISSSGSRGTEFYREGDYASLIKDLEFELADLPELPEMPQMPALPNMVAPPQPPAPPKVPNLPAMPQMPELPELPEGINSISFDYERYMEEGENYLAEWSKKYERKGGKELQKRMEDWAKRFAESGYQEKMQKWGEEYGKKFEGKWAKDMEKWGEKFGKKFEKTYAKDMEKWGEEFGKSFGKEWAKKMEAWGERFGKQMEEREKAMEERGKAMEKRQEAMEERQKAIIKRKGSRGYWSDNNNKIKKVIKIKIPKKAKLKTNIRHGELKIVSLVKDMSGDISHSFLTAEHIDGSETSINVSYSPVMIETWDLGSLNLNFVDRAQIKNAKNLVLNSKSSNVTVENLTDVAIIDGSFGDLTISNLMQSFKNINLVLENSDALINLPKNVDYSLYFKGNRSKYNNKPTTQKTITNYPDGQSSNRTISVNAKFSNVIVN